MGPRTPRGYGQLRRPGDVAPRYVHRHVWELVNGPIPEGMHVLHRCDNPPCFLLAHLFLGTHTDNMRDMVTKGRHSHVGPTSERSRSTKLTWAEVEEFRASSESSVVLAARFGVSTSTISEIRTGRTWRA